MKQFWQKEELHIGIGIGKGLFFCLLELEGGGRGIAAWRECGMFAVNGRPYITPF